MERAKSKTVRRPVVFAALAIGLGLGAIELASRVLLTTFARSGMERTFHFGDTVATTMRFLDSNVAPLSRDRVFLWSNTRNAGTAPLVNPQPAGRRDRWRIAIDSQGFRSVERRSAASGDPPFRVLCLGDSITYGYNVDGDDTYPQRLQRELEARAPGANVEVLNAGVPGWSWIQGLRFLEERGAALAPDVVVMGHGTNDRLLPALSTDVEIFQRRSSPFWALAGRLQILASASGFYVLAEKAYSQVAPAARPSPGCAEQIATEGRCRRVALADIEAAIQRAGRIVEGWGGTLLVLNSDFTKTDAIEAVRRAVLARGDVLVDLVADIESLRRRRENDRARSLGLPIGDAIAGATRKAPAASPPADLGPRSLLLRLAVDDATRAYEARAANPLDGSTLDRERLLDDGIGADEIAGDRVFSARLSVPAGVRDVEYFYEADGQAEFDTFPPLPSTLAGRAVTLERDARGPVDRFGERYLMVEAAHPDAAGHEVVARRVAEQVEALARFQALANRLQDRSDELR